MSSSETPEKQQEPKTGGTGGETEGVSSSPETSNSNSNNNQQQQTPPKLMSEPSASSTELQQQQQRNSGGSPLDQSANRSDSLGGQGGGGGDNNNNGSLAVVSVENTPRADSQQFLEQQPSGPISVRQDTTTGETAVPLTEQPTLPANIHTESDSVATAPLTAAGATGRDSNSSVNNNNNQNSSNTTNSQEGDEVVDESNRIKTVILRPEEPDKDEKEKPTSLFCFARENPFRNFCIVLTKHRYFKNFILAAILLNSVFLAMDQPAVDNPKWLDDTLEVFEYIFTSLFFLEMCLKIVALGFVLHKHAYLRSAWNVMDCIIVVASILGLPAVGVANNYSAVRVFRVLRPLRSVSRVKKLKHLIAGLFAALPMVVDNVILLFFLLILFSITSVQLWAGKLNQRCYATGIYFDDFSNTTAVAIANESYGSISFPTLIKNDAKRCGGSHHCGLGHTHLLPAETASAQAVGASILTGCIVDKNQYTEPYFSYDHIGVAMLLNLKIIVLDNWPDNVQDAMDATGPWASLYFLGLTLMGSFFCVNLFLAILTQGYSQASARMQQQKKKKAEEAADRALGIVEPGRLVDAAIQCDLDLIPSGNIEDDLGFVAVHGNAALGDNVVLEFGAEGGEEILEDDDDDSLADRDSDGEEDKKAGDGEDGGAGENDKEDDEPDDDALSMVSSSVASTVALQGDEEDDRHWVRVSLGKFVKSRPVEAFMMIVTIINVLALAMDHHGIDPTFELVLNIISLTCTALFAIEITLKLIAFGPIKTLKNGFNVLDLVLVIISIPDIILSEGGASGFSAFRVLRLLRVVRLLNRFESLQAIVSSVVHSVVSVTYLSLLILLFLYVFAIMGMQLYGLDYDRGDPEVRDSFGTLWQSLILCFIVITGDDWTDRLKQAMGGGVENQVTAVFFFLILYMIGNYILINLFVAIIMDKLAERIEYKEKEKNSHPPPLLLPRYRPIVGNKTIKELKKTKSVIRLATEDEEAQLATLVKQKSSTSAGGTFGVEEKSRSVLMNESTHAFGNSANNGGGRTSDVQGEEEATNPLLRRASPSPLGSRGQSPNASGRVSRTSSHRSAGGLAKSPGQISIDKMSQNSRNSMTLPDKAEEVGEDGVKRHVVVCAGGGGETPDQVGVPPSPTIVPLKSSSFVVQESGTTFPEGGGERTHDVMSVDSDGDEPHHNQNGGGPLIRGGINDDDIELKDDGAQENEATVYVLTTNHQFVDNINTDDEQGCNKLKKILLHVDKIRVEGDSLFVFGPENPIRRFFLFLLGSTLFNFFVDFLILANCIFLFFESPKHLSQLGKDVLDIADIVFSVFFLLEMVIKIIGFGAIFPDPESDRKKKLQEDEERRKKENLESADHPHDFGNMADLDDFEGQSAGGGSPPAASGLTPPARSPGPGPQILPPPMATPPTLNITQAPQTPEADAPLGEGNQKAAPPSSFYGDLDEESAKKISDSARGASDLKQSKSGGAEVDSNDNSLAKDDGAPPLLMTTAATDAYPLGSDMSVSNKADVEGNPTSAPPAGLGGFNSGNHLMPSGSAEYVGAFRPKRRESVAVPVDLGMSHTLGRSKRGGGGPGAGKGGGGLRAGNSNDDKSEMPVHPAYLRDGWNVCDAVVTITAFIGIFVPAFTVFRSLRTVRLMIRNESTKVIIVALLQAVPHVLNGISLAAFLYIVFGILGVSLFKGEFYRCNDESILNINECIGYYNATVQGPLLTTTVNTSRTWVREPFHFDHIGAAIVSLYVVSVGDGWSHIMYDGMDTSNPETALQKDAEPWWSLYFIISFVACNFFAFNMIIGILINYFSKMKKLNDGSALLTPQQRLYVKMQDIIENTMFSDDLVPMENGLSKVIDKFITYRLPGSNPNSISIFEFVMTLVVILNVAFLAITHDGMSEEISSTIDGVNLACLIIFTFELLIKMVAYFPRQYFSSGWNNFDFIIVLLGWASQILAWAGTQTTSISFLRVLRVSKLLRGTGAQKLLTTIAQSASSFGNVVAILLLTFFIFAVAGVTLFGEVEYNGALTPTHNFETVWNAMLVLYQIATTEGWTDIMEALSIQEPDCTNPNCGNFNVSRAYFILFMVIASFTVLQLFVAVIVEIFTEDEDEDMDEMQAGFMTLKQVWTERFGVGVTKVKAEDFVESLPYFPQAITDLPRPPHRVDLMRMLSALQVSINSNYEVQYREIVYAFAWRKFNIDTKNSVGSIISDGLFSVLSYDTFTISQLFAAEMIQEKWKELLKKRKEEQEKKELGESLKNGSTSQLLSVPSQS